MREGEAVVRLQPLEPRFFQLDIVIVAEIVEADHRAAFAQQPLGKVEADKSSGAGDQHRTIGKLIEQFHRRHNSIPGGRAPRGNRDLTSSTAPDPVAQKAGH